MDAANYTPFGRRDFYAVLSVRGTVMVFEWDAAEIAEAMVNRGLVGIIRCIEADGSIPAETEAKRLFSAGKYEKTILGRSL